MAVKDSSYSVSDTYKDGGYKNQQVFFYAMFEIDSLTEHSSRQVYNILDLFGDFGGLMEVVFLLC